MKQLKSSKKIYSWIFIFLFLFVIIIYFFHVVYENHRATVVQQQNDQLSIIANVSTNYLKTYIDEKNLEIQNNFTFKSLGQDPVVIERKVEEMIKLYWNQSPIYLDYMKYFTLEELEHVQIAGLTSQSIQDFQQKALKNNELIVGPFVQINSDNMGIYLFKGIFNEYGKFGILVGRINLAMVFHNTISNIELGKAGFLTLSDIDENFIYYGNMDGLFLSSMTSELLPKKNYLIGYSFTKVGDLNLLISARLPFHEIEKPIQITFYLLISLSFGLLILFSIFTYTLFHYQKKELAYTMDLKIQEQMHQGNRNEVIGLFSRKVAHDYNNLLAPITIYCELLEDSLTDESMLEYVSEIQQSSQQCIQLAKELLEYGHSQPSRDSAVRYESTSMLRASLKRLQLLVPSHITLKTEFTQLPLYLKGQPLELVQILYNLCINSIHAMEEAPSKNHTLSIAYTHDASHAILTVSDTGNGIPKQIQSRIFRPEFTTKTNGQGNGLGLAIVSGIVDKYRGTITFESQQGKGTTFTVRIPLSE